MRFEFPGTGTIIERRNNLIAQHCDVVISFYDGVSKGTAHTMEIATKLGKPVKIVHFNPQEKVDEIQVD